MDDIIDLNDKMDLQSNPNTKIEYTVQLATKINGKEVNGEANEGNVVKKDDLKGADCKFLGLALSFNR